MNPFHRWFASFLERDREQDVARHEGIASLQSNLVASTIEAPVDARAKLMPVVEQWVRSNLSSHVTPMFDDTATDVRVLTNGHYGAVGPVDVSVGGRGPVRSWFIAEASHTAELVFAEILDADPRVKPIVFND